MNAKTLRAAEAYLEVLDGHERVIRETLAQAKGMREVAKSFLESAKIAADFGTKIVTDAAEFQTLLELKMPELAAWDGAAMADGFAAITQATEEGDAP